MIQDNTTINYTPGQYINGIKQFDTPNISVGNITPTIPLNLGSTIVTPPDTGNGIVAGAASFATDYQAAQDFANSQVTSDNQNKANSIQSIIDSLGTQDANKGADQYNTEQGLGIPQAKQQIADVNAQILSKTAARDAQNANLEANAGGVTTSTLYGQQGAVNRASAADIGLLQARALGLQGNLTAAQETANRAVDLKYHDIEAQIQTRQNQLNAIKPLLDAEQKKKADAQQYILDRQKQDVADKKQLAKDNYGLVTDNVKYAMDAGQSQLASQITSLDPTSPTFKQDLAKLSGQIKNPTMALDIAIKQANLAKIQKETRLLGEPTAKEAKETADALKNAKTSIPATQDKIDAVDALISSAGFNARVGSSVLSRKTSPSFLDYVKGGATGAVVGAGTGFLAGGIGAIPGAIGGAILGTGAVGAEKLKTAPSDISGAGQAFAGGIHKLVSGLTLDSLIAAKARGATFGALSEGELNILANSASAINDWEIKDDKGKGTGVWNIDEGTFKKELKNIQDLSRRALLLSQGTILSPDEQSIMDTSFSPDNMALDPANYY